jgi:hypothetical protein
VLGFRLGQIRAFDDETEFSTFVVTHFWEQKLVRSGQGVRCRGSGATSALWPVMTKADSDCFRPDLRRLTLAPSKLSTPEFFAFRIWIREFRDFMWLS